MNTKTLVAARYVRNSDPAKKDSEALKAQSDALAEFGRNMGYECPDYLLYADAISALKYPYWERREMMRLWDDAERGSFDIVLCTEFFRLARKSAEQYAIMEYLKRFKVEVVSMTEKFEDTPEGHLLHAVQGFLGEVEAEKIRLRTLRGKAHRASRALTGQGSNTTYGYVWVDGQEYKKERYSLNHTVIAVIEGQEWTEVKVICACNEWCLQGMSCRHIAFRLTRLGIPTRKGHANWDRTTVRQILKNENYTGEAYNGRWTRENGTRSLPVKGTVKLPAGIYPQIIDRDTFERVQRQLHINAEMSARNNKDPSVSLLRGMIYCGICGKRMHAHNHRNPKPGRKTPNPSEYCCWTNEGTDEVLRHHYVALPMQKADEEAWQFAIPYILNPQMIRAHVMAVREQVVIRDHGSDLKEEIERINQRITNLFDLAETADPTNREGMQALRDRLSALERDKREKEKLLSGVTTVEDKQVKLFAALDRFETWAQTVRPFLHDPDYQISQEDKISALLILGVRMTAWPPTGENEHRTNLRLFPPDIARFCDGDFGK